MMHKYIYIENIDKVFLICIRDSSVPDGNVSG